MPDFSFPFPIPLPGGSPRNSYRITCADGRTIELDYKPSFSDWQSVQALCAPPQSPQPSLPTPDLPTIPLPGPAPTVQSPPTVSAESALVAQLPYAFAESSRANRSTAESRSQAANFAQAYGYAFSRRKARKMARNKRTMRAQNEIGTPIDPRTLPVPVGRAQTPQEMQRAIDSEARDRAAELRRLKQEQDALRRAPAQKLPNEAPPRARRGTRLTPIFDPFSLATDVGTIIGDIAGELIGEAKYGQTPEEAAEAKRIEDELRRRERELDEVLDAPLPAIPKRLAPPATERGMRAYGEVEQRARGRVLLPIPPTVSTAPPPSPATKNRAARALNRISNAMRNPWAQAGVFGLGLLGGRKSKRASSMPLATMPAADMPGEILTSVNPGMLPFTAPAGFGAAPPSATSSTCGCKPKRRGPKRRCLERAQVAWKTGRYKGRNAGTRCVRWE